MLKNRLLFYVVDVSIKQIKIGYARVSTDDQNLDLQRDALINAGCAEIYEEKASAKSSERTELRQCLRAIRSGDPFVVWRLDRLGRSLPDLVHIVADLEKRGIAVESLNEKIDTTTAAGRMVLHFFAMLA